MSEDVPFPRDPESDRILRAALAEADIVPQLLVQAHLSGDHDLLEAAAPYISGGWSYQHEIPDALQAAIRERLFETLRGRNGRREAGPLSKAELGRLLSVGIGKPIPDDYVAMFMDEMVDGPEGPRGVNWRKPVSAAERAKRRIVIIGAGAAGLCAGIKLQRLGIPFVIYDKNADVGGTWLENNYPGAGVDIPNHFYSYSFEPNDHWTRHFASRDELYRYLQGVADKYDLRRHIVFNTELVSAVFDDAAGKWQLTLRDGSGERADSADILVSAVGMLSRPAMPQVSGLETFGGAHFHTAAWNHEVDLAGKRVAIVGTGASAMQAAPAIAPKVDRLLVFQRSRHWALSHPLYRAEVKPGMRWALTHVPCFAKWYRFLLFWASGDLLLEMLNVDPSWPQQRQSVSEENHRFRERLLAHIHKELADRPDLIERVIPDYPPYGKRMLRDAGWYSMLKRANVDLVERGVREVTPSGLIDSEGESHAVDVIVWATGFSATRALWPMHIVGRDGVVLADFWNEDDPRAYLGITVPHFPNLCILTGPNTGLGHGGSMFFQIECQVRYTVQAVREIIENDLSTLEVRTAPYEEFARRVDAQLARMIWNHSGTRSWYHNRRGRVTSLWPWRSVDYWRATYALNPGDYIARKTPA